MNANDQTQAVEREAAAPGGEWLPIESAPKDGFFLAWSPDFPDIVSPFRADLFASMRKPGTPKHLSAHHYTLWRPMASVLP